jgi:hypothetical protein
MPSFLRANPGSPQSSSRVPGGDRNFLKKGAKFWGAFKLDGTHKLQKDEKETYPTYRISHYSFKAEFFLFEVVFGIFVARFIFSDAHWLGTPVSLISVVR